MADEELVRYIRQSRTIYSDAALRTCLLEAGHAPEAIDAAFAETDVELPGGRTPWGRTFLVANPTI